jgi:RNA polymerase sigma factor (sigma-70 family)
MILQINGVGEQKLQYKDHATIKFDDLKTYLLLAKKTISKFGSKFYSGLSAKMLKDEDAIASIANAMMMADWRWDENRLGLNGAKKTRYSYRNQCALWAMKTYVSKDHKPTKKNKVYSLDYTVDNNDTQLYSLSEDKKSMQPEEILINQEQTENLSKTINDLLTLKSLSDRQKDYIKLYYFESYTFDQIGKKYGITREAVRQGLNKALTLIKTSIES